MLLISTWNVRFFPNKQEDVKAFFRKINCGLVGLLETQIKSVNEEKAHNNMFYGWGTFFNNSHDHRGRVWVVWNPRDFDVQVLSSSAQHVHCRCLYIVEKLHSKFTFLYA